MAEPQLALVVKVIDPYTVVINKGSRHGVHFQHEFLIFENGEELKDPETGESLGKLEIVKGRGEVKHLQESLTTIRSSTTHQQRASYGLGGSYGTPGAIILAQQPEYTDVVNAFENPKIGDFARVL
jgi:hypothetical protein